MDIKDRIGKAEAAIRPYLRETPLEYSYALSKMTGAEVHLKLENIQITGSFKARGALNKILSLQGVEGRIVTASTGNHGLGVANALSVVKRAGTIFLPANASPAKVEAIRMRGVPVEFLGETCEETEMHVRRNAEKTGDIYVSPYNDIDVMAGQGSIGVELLRQLPSLDAVFISVGGGGLIGGITATAIVIRMKRLPFTRISDATSIGLAAAYSVGRSGCWAVGDDYGRPWNSPLAVKFPDGAPPSTVGNMVSQFGLGGISGHRITDVMGVYPTQLFEVAMGLVMFAVLWRMRDHKHAEGWLFGVYCVLAGIERFLVEFFRAKDDRFFAGFTLAQTIAIGFVALGVVWMQMRRTPRDGAPGIYASA